VTVPVPTVPAPTEALRMLHERLGDRVQRDVPLAPLTTYRVGGAAAGFVDVT
jgi:UDP-N-acetylmuramate dehydrogenase